MTKYEAFRSLISQRVSTPPSTYERVRQWVCGLVADELADVLLRDPPSHQKFDQVAVNWGRHKFLPPGATRYARHFDHSYL